MKERADMKKKKATDRPALEYLDMIHSGDKTDDLKERDFIKSHCNRKLRNTISIGFDKWCGKDIEETVEADRKEWGVAESNPAAQEESQNVFLENVLLYEKDTDTRLARDFLAGNFKRKALQSVGVDFLYKFMVRFYKLWGMAKGLNKQYSVQDHPDLAAVLSARKERGLPVRVCGEGVDIAKEIEETRWGLLYAKTDDELRAVKQRIDESVNRLRSLQEEVYETLKRGERRAAKAGAVALAQFNATKDAALKLGAPDMKQAQRERAAKWLIAERAAGHKASIVDAAQHFYKEISDEKSKGGYKNTNALLSALNKQAAALGIAQFIEPKRGRPRKQ